jgi:hypothetical protein
MDVNKYTGIILIPQSGSFKLISLTFYTRIASPDAPDLFFVGRLGIICQKGSGQCAAGPAELKLLRGCPAFEYGIKHAAYKSVAAADTIKHINFTGLDHMPVITGEHNGTTEMGIGAGCLHKKCITAMDGLPVDRCNAYTHAGGNQQSILICVSKLHVYSEASIFK